MGVTGNRISVRFEYEWPHATSGHWYRTHGNEHWEFDDDGLMSRRDMSANDIHNGDIPMRNIEVYSSHNCPWCGRAKALLESKGLDYEEINISTDNLKALEMIERSGRRTVPQIFIDDVPIGGFDELSAMHQAGKLN